VHLWAGWNLVGFPEAYGNTGTPTASAILGGLLGQTHGAYARLDGFAAGQWGPSYYDDAKDGLASAGDFSVTAGQGYALYTDVPCIRVL
jgi:hypothetical protein